jgi:hypothetical protein
MPDIVAGLVGIGFLILWLYCIYDVITTDEAIIRHLPKVVWLLIVIFLSDLGSILWLALGRPQIWTRQVHDPQRYGSHRIRSAPSRLVDDGPFDHLSPIVRHREELTRIHMLEAQLRRREEELRRRELGEGSGPAD